MEELDLLSITMYVPLGIRHGTMSFVEEHNVINGILEVFGNQDAFTGTLTETGIVELKGKMTPLLHSFSYVARGTIANSNMDLNVVGGRYSFRITGEEIGL